MESPIMLKAKEIYDTVSVICDLIPPESEYLVSIKNFILTDAAEIVVKLASAEKAKLWDIKMESTMIIRRNARSLTVHNHSLAAFGFEDASYYKIVRKQIEEFRLLFRDWVAGFNPKHFITDEWGLLNPPGIPQDYVQRDDELNFLDEEDENFF